MYASLVVILVILLFMPTESFISVNIYNNACTNYSDYFIRFWSKHCYYNPNVLSDTPTLIKMNGYPVEGYKVTTQDDYILTIFRIPPQNNKRNKQPVFLMHGIISNSGVWVHVGNRSLAFNLADEGYDVWLGTIRGTNFAKSHKYFKTSSQEYWNFNLDSLAYFDVGEQLKFVANKTGKWGSIIYLGHSMGSTLGFLFASGHPEEASGLLSGIVALAPVLYLQEIGLVDVLMQIAPVLEKGFDILHMHGLFYQNDINNVVVHICVVIPHVCKNVLELTAGHFTDQFRPDELLVFLSYCPSGVSVQVLEHYKQFAATDLIRRYDYGRMKNIQTYHHSEPIIYNLSHINVPVYLFYGQNDVLAPEKGAERLFKQLGTTRKGLQRIPKNNETTFNHLDFLMAKNIKQYLYTELFRVMQEHLKAN